MPSSLDAIMGSVEPSLTQEEKVTKMIQTRRLRVVVFQGPPGSGKSTLAKEVHNLLTDEDCTIASADHAFEQEDGTFKFKKHLLQEAHTLCQAAALKGIADDKVVLIDNTNIKVDHVRPYVDMVVPSKIAVVKINPTNDTQARKCAERGIHAPFDYSMRAWKQMETIPRIFTLNLSPQF